tara:strand:- start:8 stop:814 length:807 start_codon:yes stop_codon:yes gene_type:complete
MPLKSEKEIAQLEEAYGQVTYNTPDQFEGETQLVSDTGPEAAEGFEAEVPEYEKKKDKGTEENAGKSENLVQDNINTFNNNSIMNNPDNIFDKLYNTLMESDDLPAMDEDPFAADAGDDFGGEDLGGEEDGETLTIELPREVAEQLHQSLGDLLDVDPESEIEDLDGGDSDPFGDDSEEPFADSIEVVADPRPLADSNLKSGNNSNKANKPKASGYSGKGGKAQSGKIPETQADPKELADTNLKSGNNSNMGSNKVQAGGYGAGELIK